jgi:hypothetical protein
MPLVTTSIDAFLTTSTLIILVSIYAMRPGISSREGAASAPLRTPLSILVLLHTIYILYTILVTPPPNLFSRLRIPLITPSDKIRTLLLARAGLPADALLPTSLEDLLTRLAAFDVRTTYIRLVLSFTWIRVLVA